VFDDKLIWGLVRHVRSLSYTNDLDPDSVEVKTPPPGLQQLQACPPQPNNLPWTTVMKQHAAGQYKGTAWPGNPVTGGLSLPNEQPVEPVYSAQPEDKQSATKGRTAP
jgi:hypothetical protein